MPRSRRYVAVLLATMALLSGCGPIIALTSTSSHNSAANVSCVASACQPGPGTQEASVFVEPDAGAAPVTHAIEHATTSIWLEVYLLTDSTVIRALESAANRGVDVRVLLELAPYGQGSVSPQITLERLQASGVKAEGANPSYQYTHAKMMVVDQATAFIMTCNLTLSGLGGSHTATNRDYGVIDTNPVDVAAATSIFQADWSRTTAHQSDPNLVISPIDSRAKLISLLASARSQMLLEDEELVDPQVSAALTASAKRGVIVEIVLPAPSGSSPAANLSPLLVAGVHVRYSSHLYMHAKLIVVDGARAFVGSENFSANSLDNNREIGVIVASADVLSTLTTTFVADWSAGTPA